jgi:hypothetical protein
MYVHISPDAHIKVLPSHRTCVNAHSQNAENRYETTYHMQL